MEKFPWTPERVFCVLSLLSSIWSVTGLVFKIVVFNDLEKQTLFCIVFLNIVLMAGHL